MIQLRPASTRGHADHGWLQTWHSFAFADYVNPQAMGWGALRVINEDWIAPGQGFASHGHRDMEILTVVRSGVLQHRDSLGNGTLIYPGEVQRMSAGRGVRHSEFNPSADQPTHLLQIWITPAQRGGAPGYEQRARPPSPDAWTLLASPDGEDGSVRLQQQARVWAGQLLPGQRLTYALAAGRLAYLQGLAGSVQCTGTAGSAGMALGPGDGAAIRDESLLTLASPQFPEAHPADFLLFDLPAETPPETAFSI